ncbi:MAG: hypothetical protein JXA50_06700 [Deltaproteobacteria bacterium]|nr:hypothetical protein [Deltaproteobacteria bacterium]
MLKRSKRYDTSGKIFFLILIVFFLFAAAQVAYSQSIRLLIPNGGETWVIGQEKYISWTSEGLSADTKVKLELFHHGMRIGTIISNRSNPGGTVAWKWDVGDYQGGTAAPDSGYYIHVTTMDGQYTDRTDRSFRLCSGTIPSITVTNPRSNSVWYHGNTYNITWESEGLGPYMEISLLDQNRRFIRKLFDNAFNDGTHPWTIPEDISPGTYIIDIRPKRGFDIPGNPIWDRSEPFKIRVLLKPIPGLKKIER